MHLCINDYTKMYKSGDIIKLLFKNEHTNMQHEFFNPASKAELIFIRENMPRGMVAMIQVRTGLNRSQILYQLLQMPDNQNAEVVQAARDILYAVKRIEFQPTGDQLENQYLQLPQEKHATRNEAIEIELD